MAEVVLLVEAEHWLVGEVLRGFIVVLPRPVALVELDYYEDHDGHHCQDYGQVDQKGSADAKEFGLAVGGWRRGADLVRRRRVGYWRRGGFQGRRRGRR